MTRKKLILFIVIGVLAIGAIVGGTLMFVFSREGIAVSSWSGSGIKISNAVNDTWTVTAGSLSGNSRMDITFDEAKLAALHVKSTDDGGKVTLVRIQGDVERATDISGEFDGAIDMTDFEPGRIRLRLEFDRAEGLSTVISWK